MIFLSCKEMIGGSLKKDLVLQPKLAVKRIPRSPRGFCHEETKVTNLSNSTGSQICCWTNKVRAPKDLVFFRPIRQKSRFWTRSRQRADDT